MSELTISFGDNDVRGGICPIKGIQVTPPSPRFERWPLGSIHSCSVLPQSSIDSLLSGSRKCAKPSSLVIGELFACFIKDQLHQGFFASAGEVIRDRAPLWPGDPAGGGDLQRALTAVPAGIWWTALYPGLAMFVLVLGLSFLGEGLEQWLSGQAQRSS